uniref:Uncharacterized protein n=1 Tax=Panagrolaimus davidi TaxID=227884 RepID=A0A914QRD2_9BILA
MENCTSSMNGTANNPDGPSSSTANSNQSVLNGNRTAHHSKKDGFSSSSVSSEQAKDSSSKSQPMQKTHGNGDSKSSNQNGVRSPARSSNPVRPSPSTTKENMGNKDKKDMNQCKISQPQPAAKQILQPNSARMLDEINNHDNDRKPPQPRVDLSKQIELMSNFEENL